MPAWRNHDAGRRGRDAYETDDYFDAPRREPADSRIERLTRTATALGAYDPNYEEDHDEDLSAVADELDRLLSERGEPVSPRQKRSGRSVRAAKERPAADRREPSRPRRRRDLESEAGIDDVMGALDRLDEQVQGLAGDDEETGFYRPEPRQARRQPGRYAMDRLEDADPHDGDEAAYEAGRHSNAYDDDDGYEASRPRRRAQREASIHAYKDLGRRIDALRAPQEKALNHVREELAYLRDALGGMSRGTGESVNRQNAEMRRLSDMVERLRADKKNDQFAREIRKEVSELKTMVGRTNVEGALQTLEHGYSHILQRLDELSRASVDPRVLQGVTARLGEIEDAFAALPRSEHMVVLEDRVVSIAERMEELLQRKSHQEIEPLREELREVRDFVERIDIKGLLEGIDDRMKFVSGRLDDLENLAREQRGLDSRLSAMEERMPEADTLSRLQGRLEDIVGMMSDDRATPADFEHMSQVDRRLDEIVDRLERMEQSPPLPGAGDSAFKALEKRLETISCQIDAIEQKTSRQITDAEAASLLEGHDGQFLSQLQDRLNDLTARLDQPRDTVTASDLERLREEIGSMRASVLAPVSTEALEQRISDLAQVVSRGAEGTDDSRFEQLGAKVAALAEQIESTSARTYSADQLAPVLERIEKGLEQTRADVAGIARKAAEEAVAKAPAADNGQYDEAINELQADLKRLLDAAEGTEERTLDTFDGVKSVLGSLTDRLDRLEGADGDQMPEGRAFSFSPVQTSGRGPVYAEPAAKTAPQADARDTRDRSEPQRPEERARDRKADFIAAARRAAQAASAEAAQLEKNRKPGKGEEGADEERGKARVGWLRNVLRRDKSANTGKTEAETADELELGEEHLSDVPEADDGSHVLPGDRPAPEVAQGSSGRRRAILYTAAAVVLLIGTLQIVRVSMNAPDGGDQLASAAGGKIETAEVVPSPAKAEPAKVASAASAGGKPVVAGSEPSKAPEAKAAGANVQPPAVPKAESRPAASAPVPATTQAAQPPKVAAAPVLEPETVPDKPGDNLQTTSASGMLEPETELAFAPPAGVSSSFADKPADDTSTLKAPSDATASSGTLSDGLIASLPPEGVGPMSLRSAAAAGNPAAEFLVGVKYTEGSGVPADLEKAAVWYQKAAEKGLAPAQYRLASLYEKGRGVEKDLQKAMAWYVKAAEAGNAKAMHNLAVLYAEGAGAKPDYAAAAKWFEMAANFGVKDSLFNLGILYAGGIGVEKDLVASYKWFAIAADQGDPEAAKRRDDVANMMDKENLAKARLAVENFKLKMPSPDANKVVMDPSWSDSASLPASKASMEVAPVESPDMIRKAQEKLNYLGFDTGTPDGQMGPRTRSAIRAFQRTLGQPETGLVDRKLIEELDSQAI